MPSLFMERAGAAAAQGLAEQRRRRLDWFIPSWLENYDAFEETENETFAEIGIVTATQVFAAACFFSYFTYKRWKDPTYFSPRRLRKPPEMPPPQEGLLAWVWYTARIPDSEFLNTAGFDALVYIRFYLLAAKVCVASAVYCWLVILPVNVTSDYYEVSGSDINDFSRISMSNISPGSARLWIHVVGMYIVTAVCFFFLNGEFKTWTRLRHQYLKLRAPHMRTIMLEDLPADMRSNARLFLYFNTLYPNSVLTVACTQDLRHLSKLLAQRESVLTRLERAMVKKAKTGKCVTAWKGWLLCCGEQVDVIEDLTEQLQRLNVEVGREQNKKLHRLRFTDRRTSRATEGIHSLHLTELLDEDDIGPIEHYLQRTQAPVLAADDAARTPGNTTPVATPASARHVRVRGASEDSGGSVNADNDAYHVGGIGAGGIGIGGAGSGADAGAGNSRGAGHGGADAARLTAALPSAMENMAMRLQKLSSGLTGSSAVERQEELEGRRERLLEESAAAGKGGDGGGGANAGGANGGGGAGGGFGKPYGNASEMAPKAYVTFKTFSAATIARQVFHASMPGRLKAVEAPEPRDVYWGNTYVTKRARMARRIFVETFLAALYIFWVVPVTLFYLLFSEDALESASPLIAKLCEESTVFAAMVEVIQPMCLLCLMSMLPPLIRVLGMVEGVGSESYNQQLVLSRYFYFQVINVFLVTVLAGSVFDTLSLIIEKPSQTFELLGEALPKVCGFFCEYIVIKMFAGLWIEMSRSISSMQDFILRLVWPHETPRDKAAIVMGLRPYFDAGWFNFPKYYAQDLLVVVVTLTYACINPFILLVSGSYFICAHLTYKHQMLYVYEPAYESGGIMFPKVFRRFIFAIFVAQATMVGVLLLKEGYYEAGVAGALMVVTWVFKGKQRGTYEPVSLSLPLEIATSLDLHDEQLRPEEAESKDAYLQPELKADPMATPDVELRDLAQQFQPKGAASSATAAAASPFSSSAAVASPFSSPAAAAFPFSSAVAVAAAPPGLSPPRRGGDLTAYQKF